MKVGYIWQYESSQLKPVAATALHVRAVVTELQRRGHAVRMVSIRQGQPHFSDDLETWRPIPVRAGRSFPFRSVERVVRGVQQRLRLPYFRLFESYRFSRACVTALQDYDVLYERFWLMASGGLMATRTLSKRSGRRVPLIYEVNGDLVEEYAQLGIDLSDSQWAAVHWVTQQMFQRAGRVVTVSETLRQSTLERWSLPVEQVTTVPNGVRVDLFASDGHSQPEPETVGGNGSPAVIFVGSFKPWHGVDLLLEAFSHLPDGNGARLVLVGDGPAIPDLKTQAQALGLGERVVFTGAVPHPLVAEHLQQAEIAVLNPRLSPASLAQSPLKLFEYMAAGKAIVAPEQPNIQGVLADCKNALLVPPDDAQALATALERLLDDDQLRRRLGAAAREQALAQYSWERTVKELEAIFEQEVGKG